VIRIGMSFCAVLESLVGYFSGLTGLTDDVRSLGQSGLPGCASGFPSLTQTGNGTGPDAAALRRHEETLTSIVWKPDDVWGLILGKLRAISAKGSLQRASIISVRVKWGYAVNHGFHFRRNTIIRVRHQAEMDRRLPVYSERRADEQNNSLNSSTMRGPPIGAARSLITQGERWLILHLLPPHIWPG
jgi:hypothetical protein